MLGTNRGWRRQAWGGMDTVMISTDAVVLFFVMLTLLGGILWILFVFYRRR